MRFIKKHKFISAIISFTLVYFIACTGLYFLEPVSYSAPDLNSYDEYFDMYSYYSKKNTDDEFYIKQISADDILSVDNDVRLKYVKNTANAVADDNATYDAVTTLLAKYNANICGYIKNVNFYQIEFADDISYDELVDICKKLTDSDIFAIVLPDYFEEMPTDSKAEINSSAYENENYYYEMINASQAFDIYYKYNTDVNVGIIDTLIDYDNSLLNVVNSNTYTTESLTASVLYGAESHGTHVAGIINAIHSDDVLGMASNADIYSYNGVNVSTSYWIASVCDMLIRQNVKVVNISMGYNSYISISAQLGDENAVEYIRNGNVLFSEIISNIIGLDKEFVICIAAGNSTTTPLYKTDSAYFGYGDKKLLSKIDRLGIFDSCPKYVDAKYSFLFSDAMIDDVADRIITVGSVGDNSVYTYYSNAGKVDIVAPGERIKSTVLNNKFNVMSGTSMATPFVSGTAAMMFTVNPDLTGAEVKELIISGSTETVSVYDYSYPVLNSGNAVALAEAKQ